MLSPTDVAKELNCTTQWVTELLRQKRLKGTKWGRQWIITPDDLKEFKAKQEEAKNAKK